MKADRVVPALDVAEAGILASAWEVKRRRFSNSASSVETKNRVRIAFAAACPEATLFAGMPAALLRRRI